jgi:hypothetical protein
MRWARDRANNATVATNGHTVAFRHVSRTEKDTSMFRAWPDLAMLVLESKHVVALRPAD